MNSYVSFPVKETSYESVVKMLGKYVRSERLTKRNQWVHHFKGGTMMQSYDSVCGVHVRGRWYFGTRHDASATTNKYMGRWCGMGAHERNRAMLDGKAFHLAGEPCGWVSGEYIDGYPRNPLFRRKRA